MLTAFLLPSSLRHRQFDRHEMVRMHAEVGRKGGKNVLKNVILVKSYRSYGYVECNALYCTVGALQGGTLKSSPQGHFTFLTSALLVPVHLYTTSPAVILFCLAPRTRSFMPGLPCLSNCGPERLAIPRLPKLTG